jgi:hypothetical protein
MTKGEMILSTGRGYRIKSMKRLQRNLKIGNISTYIRKNTYGGFSLYRRRY